MDVDCDDEQAAGGDDADDDGSEGGSDGALRIMGWWSSADPTGRADLYSTAAALLRLAPDLWAQGLAVPAEQAMPLYIRDKVANTTAEREAMKAQTALDKTVAQP